MDKHLGDRKTSAVTRSSFDFRAESPFVGRDEELSRLSSKIDLAAEGQGGTVFLIGEPGIGKTRLAREALGLAKARGFTVLEGCAYPLEAGLTYAPVIDAFGPVLRSYDSFRREILVSDLPSLGRIFEGLQLPTPEPLNDAALEKTRLFEAVSRLLKRLADKSPVAILIDDIHRADPATLELLHYLARGLSDDRALLLATYSTHALDTPQGLRSLVVSLKRGRMVQEIVVPRLGQGAVDQLVRGILGEKAPEGFLDLLDARAEGNPLFIESLLTGIIDSGHLVHSGNCWTVDAQGATAVPPGLRQLILERLERLEPQDRHILDLVAIMGSTTSYDLLRSMSGLAEENLMGILRRLRATGLVVDGRDGPNVVYSLTHPLIQEVAYAELPEIERRRAHMAAIEALESSCEGRPEDINRLAHHYHGAGAEADPDKALAVFVAAGERARIAYASEEAARHYFAALEMARRGRIYRRTGQLPLGPFSLAPAVEEPLLPWLLERLGETWDRIGRRDAAVEAWSKALAEREKGGDAVAASRIHSHLALAEWDRGHIDTAKAHLEAGLMAVAGQGPCQELADLQFARLTVHNRLGDAAGVADAAKQLLAIAQQMASPLAEAEANLAAGRCCLVQNDLAAACQHGLQGLALVESCLEGQQTIIFCRAHCLLADVGMRQGNHHFIRHHAELGISAAQRFGDPSMEVVHHIYLAFANFMAGSWDESRRCSTKAIVLARSLGHHRHLASAVAERAVLLALQGDLVDAEACISEARTNFTSGAPLDRYIFGLLDIAEVAVALRHGRADRALSVALGFVHQFSSTADAAGLTPRNMPVGLMLLAEAQVAAGEPEAALETAGRLSDLGPNGLAYPTALASRAEGLARQAMGQHKAAAECLAQAHAGFTALRMPFEAARSLLELAISSAGRPELAERAVRESLTVFQGLGAQYYVERCLRVCRRLGLTLSHPRSPRPSGGLLTNRELEIARLVAEGLDTAEIATRLCLSRRTVTTHFERIYSRLGVHSRAELVRYVIKAGLVPIS